MTDIRSEFSAATRERQLRYIASAIHGFTIMARDPDASEETRAKINNLIHYLAGHLIALTNPEEPLLESRLDAIMAYVEPLNSRLRENIRTNLSRSA